MCTFYSLNVVELKKRIVHVSLQPREGLAKKGNILVLISIFRETVR